MRMCAFTDPIDIAWQLLCFLDHHNSVLERVAARRMPEVRAGVELPFVHHGTGSRAR